jgi:hypothetical protein
MSDLLPDKAEHLPREAKKTSDTTLDRIYKYYHDRKRHIVLSPKEEEIRKRLDFLWRMRCKPYNRAESLSRWLKEFNLSNRLFYNDWKAVEIIFGDPIEESNKSKRAIANEILLSTIRKAREEKDYASVERLMARYAAINRLEEDDNTISEMVKKLVPHTFIITSNPDILKKQAEELMQNIPAQDIDFEDITEKEGSDED